MMKKLSLTILAGIALTTAAHAQTQEKATHVWIDAGSASSLVNVRTAQMCDVMVQQAAKLEGSAEGHCYNEKQFLKAIECKINISGKSKHYRGGPVECE